MITIENLRIREQELKKKGFDVTLYFSPGKKPLMIIGSQQNFINLDDLPNAKIKWQKRSALPNIHSTQMQGFKKGWLVGLDLLDHFPWIKLTFKKKKSKHDSISNSK